MKRSLIILLVAAMATHTAEAQRANPDTATRNFIIQASISNLNEISSGHLAAQKAMDADVKAFGDRMVTDHTNAQAKLMQLAKAGGYQIPPEATGGTMPSMSLKNSSGNTFDRLYVHMVVPDHRSAVSMFENYAVTGKDPAIKAFVLETLPVLKEHLATITALDNRLNNMAAK